MAYTPPIRDLMFALIEIADVMRVKSAAFPDFDVETLSAVLGAAGAMASGVLAPLNSSGDRDGARFDNGRVLSAPGFREAYRTYTQGGWNALSAPPEFGGQGLPKALETAVLEVVDSANLAFGLCPVLTQSAIELLVAHGSEQQKSLYLERLVNGEWTGTMNLTEPQAGSDLAQLRMRAEPDGKGKYRLYGQKIFITWGDHDFSDNIIHFVLARLPGAPDGTRGISLFLAPKRLVGEDGVLGAANTLKPISIEHKLGIHASPTCVMAFDRAEAELVGAENRGLAQMFTMMNAARLQVGVQGVAIAERAFQRALTYARERKQGRSIWTGENPAAIFDHPDVRRMLIQMKAKIEAGRAICFLTAVSADLARTSSDVGVRDSEKLREELLTPVAKAWSTDIGVEVASLALQVHGGMGFIEETGAAQHYRDARIAPIYEGTNGIQAIDLVGRKLLLEGGLAMRNLLDEIRSCCTTLKASDYKVLQNVGVRLDESCTALEASTNWLYEHSGKPDAFAGATPYLKLLGDVTGGWLLAKGALAAAQHARQEENRSYWQTKIRLAAVYADHVLTLTPGLAAVAAAGADNLFEITADGLAG